MDAQTLAKIVQVESEELDALVDASLIQTKTQILAEKKKQFSEKGANDWDSELFPKLAASTISKKRSKGNSDPDQPLYDTGELKESLTMGADPLDWDAESTSDHAAYSTAWLNKKGASHTFDLLSEKEFNGAVDFFANLLKKG